MLSTLYIVIIVVSIVVIGGAGFSLYWFGLRKDEDLDTPIENDPVQEEERVTKIGSVKITRSRNTKDEKLHQGEHLIIEYVGDYWPDTQPKTFSYSIDDRPSTVILQDAQTRQTTWTVPSHIYTNKLVFQISSKGTTLNSDPWAVTTFWRASGPTGNPVVGESCTFTLKADSKIVSGANPLLEISNDDGKTWENASASYNPARVNFLYTPTKEETNIKFRIRSTALVKHGYPEELVSTISTSYNFEDTHENPVTVGGDITSFTVQDSQGGKIGIVQPRDAVLLVWEVSGGLDLTTIDVSWSASSSSGFKILQSDVPAQSQYALVNLPRRETLTSSVNQIYLKIQSGDHMAVSAALSFTKPSWEYEDDPSVQHDNSFGSVSFYVPVRASQIDDVEEFFNSANWSYKLSSPGSGCSSIISSETSNNFTKYGDISINGSVIKDVYFVTFEVQRLVLPWFGECAQSGKSNGIDIDFIDLQVDLGYKPWDGETALKVNPKTILLSTSASQDNTDQSQDWGKASLRYSSGKDANGHDHWVAFKPVPSSPTQVTFDGTFTVFNVVNGTSKNRVVVGYQNASNITEVVTWKLVYVTKPTRPLILRSTSSPQTPTERAIEFVLPSDTYDRAYIEVSLESDPKKFIRSPQFVVRPVLALNHRVDSSGTASVETVSAGTKFPMHIYGGTFALKGLDSGQFRMEYTEAEFVSYEEDETIGTCVLSEGITCGGISSKTWISIADKKRINASFGGVDRDGNMTVTWTPGNRTFANPIRLRFVTDGLAHDGLPEIHSEATYKSFKSENLSYDPKLQVILTNDISDTAVHEIGQVIYKDHIKISAMSGKAIGTPVTYDNGWKYRVFIGGSEYTSTATEYSQKDIINSHGHMVIDTSKFKYHTIGKTYFLSLQLKSDPSTILLTERFKFGSGFRIEKRESKLNQDYFAVAFSVIAVGSIDVTLETGITIDDTQKVYQKETKAVDDYILITYFSKDEKTTSPFEYIVPWKDMTSKTSVELNIKSKTIDNPSDDAKLTLFPRKDHVHSVKFNTNYKLTLPKGLKGNVTVKKPLNPDKMLIHPVYGIIWTDPIPRPVPLQPPSLPGVEFHGTFDTSYQRKKQQWRYRIPKKYCDGRLPSVHCEETKFSGIPYNSRIAGGDHDEWVDVLDCNPSEHDDRPALQIIMGKIGPHSADDIQVMNLKLTPYQQVRGTKNIHFAWNYGHTELTKYRGIADAVRAAKSFQDSTFLKLAPVVGIYRSFNLPSPIDFGGGDITRDRNVFPSAQWKYPLYNTDLNNDDTRKINVENFIIPDPIGDDAVPLGPAAYWVPEYC